MPYANQMSASAVGVDLVPGGSRLPVRTRDGRELAAVEAGEGPVTVLLEAGAGASAASWYGVWVGLVDHARVVAYDRAGLGCSTPDRRPRTVARMAEDLEDVIAACPPGPVLLIGHSLGGPLSRLAAAACPDRVVGLVLCDPAQEELGLYYTRGYRLSMTVGPRVMLALAHLRLLKPVLKGMIGKGLQGTPLPADVVAAIAAEMASPAMARGSMAEAAALINSFRMLREDTPDIKVPLTIVSGGAKTRRDEKLRTTFVGAHVATAAKHGGRHVLAHRSGHLVPQCEPEVVVEETLRMIHATS